MLPALTQYRPGTGTYRHVYRAATFCIRSHLRFISLISMLGNSSTSAYPMIRKCPGNTPIDFSKLYPCCAWAELKYSKLSIKHTPLNIKLNEDCEKSIKLVPQVWCFLTIWLIFQLFPELIWYLGGCFIEILLISTDALTALAFWAPSKPSHSVASHC